MGRKQLEVKRDNTLQLRINQNEREKLEYISKTLNLSFREVFTLSLDMIMGLLEKMSNNENLKK